MKGVIARVPRPTLLAMLLIPLLLLLDALCYQVTLPVTLDIQHGQGILTVGGTVLSLGKISEPLALSFPAVDPLVHEYQIDDSDSTNNQDLDTTYLSQISDSLYYRFQSWMRDLDGTSRWRGLRILANGRLVQQQVWPVGGGTVALPPAAHLQIDLQLQRPETPASLSLLLSDGQSIQVMLDRNDRELLVTDPVTDQTIARAFFPFDVAPFAAMVGDTVVRILLWALVILLAMQLLETLLGLLRASLRPRAHPAPLADDEPEPASDEVAEVQDECVRSLRDFALFRALHPLALLGLGCSLVFVIWIAVVEYQGQPHIYDASAYLFAAKMYAAGHFAVTAPVLPKLFPGAFMAVWEGQWFAQYDPGTALTLVPGLWLGTPWLVEPLLGTLALLGIGLIAARLYNRRVATLAVLLGCLSPFYSYLAASYLSHAVALFYLVWGLWALLRFMQGGSGWNLPLSALSFGMAALTRDQVALLYIAILLPGTIFVTWKHARSRPGRTRWSLAAAWLGFIAILLTYVEFYLGLNTVLTGDPFLTPRQIFFAGDHWGFGTGIGFYGQHTLAAGLVNLDELLTSLQIDLFGWPFYLTLAFIALPFLLLRARRSDWFLLVALSVTVVSYTGYFYHGIYLGPRYLFEDLPFLLILTARGILFVGAWSMERGYATAQWLCERLGRSTAFRKPVTSLATIALVGALLLCNLIYYLPRQVARYWDYNGLPISYTLDTSQIYHTPLRHAIVVTGNQTLYQLVLFPLNDPQLKGSVIYALAMTFAQYEQLHRAFPERTLYLLVVNPEGAVSYLSLDQ